MKAAEIPPYLRFDVKLSYMALYERTIGEKFEWVQMILQPFKQALTGSKFEFLGVLSKDKSDFKDSSSLLSHIDKLLQILTRCRAYDFQFHIKPYIDVNYSSTHILAALLQFDAIVRCSKITVEFNFGSSATVQMSLPIEAIENWLNRTIANGQEDNKRFLFLEISYGCPNVSEMFEHLKKVYHSLFFVN